MFQEKPIVRYISLFINSFITPEGQIQLISPIMSFTLNEVPSNITLSICVSLSKLNPNKKYAQKLELVSPSGELAHLEQSLIDQTFNNGDIGTLFKLENILIKEFGKHPIYIYLDDEKIGEQYLDIYKSGEFE